MIKTYLTDADKAAGKEDYFQKVGDTFYKAQESVFGKVSNYYAVDPFHEGGMVPDGFDIVDIYRTVQRKMLDHDPAAVWVMQLVSAVCCAVTRRHSGGPTDCPSMGVMPWPVQLTF